MIDYWRTMNLEKIRNVIQEYADRQELKLFDVAYHRNDATLSVVFDETFDMERLETVSAQLSAALDPYEDEFADNYFLDVSTVGLERPIRNETEMRQAEGKYVCLETKEKEYYGTLKSFQNEKIVLELKDKTRTKEIEIDYKEIRKARHAVKF